MSHTRTLYRRTSQASSLGGETAWGGPMQEKAVQRLSMVAFGIAALQLSLGLDLLKNLSGIQKPVNQLATNVTSVTIITLSALIIFLARQKKLPAGRLLDLGLLYEVAVAFAIELSGHLNPWPPADVMHYELVRMVSWVCIWIIMFPLLVPVSPGKATLAAFSAALMGPIAIMLAMTLGIPHPEASTIWFLTLPNFVAAILATVASRLIYKLERDVSKAREMGSYQLEELLDKGGMGEVWRAKHRMLIREAAVKLIRAEFSDERKTDLPTIRQRFQREAQATAVLRSPHTVELYDFGSTDDGTFYYVMELLDGIDAESLVRRFGPVPAERAVYLLCQVCDSLGEAHRNGLIHRDIKPSNIFLCCPGEQVDFVKVLDFGLVTTERAEGSGENRLTELGVTAGTPAYMAPEMAMNTEKLDGRADIYALGCVGYWLMTGQTVFDAPSAVQLAISHVQQKPVAPSKRTELPIPEALDGVIMQCLAKNPDLRPQSAAELAASLRAGLNAKQWSREQARRWWQTHLPDVLRTSTPDLDSGNVPQLNP